MTTQPREFTLRGYLQSVRRQWWLLLAIALLGAGVGIAYAKLQKPSYAATASIAVNDPNQSLALFGGSFTSGKTPLQEASAAANQVTRPEVISAVSKQLGRAINASDVSVAIDPNSYVVNITVSSGSRSEAAAIANAFADVDTSVTTSEVRKQYAQQASAIQKQARQFRNASTTLAVATVATYTRLQSLSKLATPMTVTTRATEPAGTSKHTARDAIIGLLIGLLLGVGVATARDALDRRLRHSRDVAEVLDQPVIGYVPGAALGHARLGSSNGTGELTEADQESFRILRENVSYFGVGAKTIVLVTSSGPEEGKSTVAACLAVATAEAGKRTLLVECDLRKPVLAQRLGIRESPGLTDYLTGHAQPHEILQPVGIAQPLNGNGPGKDLASNLVCISSGSRAARPAELLASKRFHDFLAEVSDVYETVILDTAPLLSVADTLAIVPAASMLLVCVRLDRTKREQARAARAALDRLPERPVGVVVTDARHQGDGYYDFYGTPSPPISQTTSV